MYSYIRVHAHILHHPSPYPSQLFFWDRANLGYGGVVVSGSYASSRMSLVLPRADPEQVKKDFYNNPCPAVFLLDKEVHTYLMVDGSLFPLWSNTKPVLELPPLVVSWGCASSLTCLVLGLGWWDSWHFVKHASGLWRENMFTGFCMSLLRWIVGSLIVTTSHRKSCSLHQGNGINNLKEKVFATYSLLVCQTNQFP